MKNYSRQRETIINVLRMTTSHPSAQWVYEEVRKTIPNVSLGTVYRNLANLKESGDIISFKLDDGTEHFDGNITPHSHFCCSRCLTVFDLFKFNASVVESELKKELNNQIKLHSSLFYGVCDKCSQPENINQ